MGGGWIAVPLTTSPLVVGAALVAEAARFGIVSTVSFPYLASMIPAGKPGPTPRCSTRFARSAPRSRSPRRRADRVHGELPDALLPQRQRDARRARPACPEPGPPAEVPAEPGLDAALIGALASLYAVVLASGLLVTGTISRTSTRRSSAGSTLGPGPHLLFEVRGTRAHYLLLEAVTLVVAALSRPRRLRSLLALELVSVGLALGLLQAIYAVYDRPRPSEVFERAEIVLAHGQNWAAIESFPSRTWR